MVKLAQHFFGLAVVCFLIVSIAPLSISLSIDSKCFSPLHYQYKSNVFELYLMGCALCVGIVFFWEELSIRFHWTITFILMLTFLLISTAKVIVVGSEMSPDWLLSLLLGLIVFPALLPLLSILLLKWFSRETQRYDKLHNRNDSVLDRLIDNKRRNDIESAEGMDSQEAATKVEEKQHATFNRLLKWSHPEWKLLSFGLIMLVLASACTMAQPLYFGQIIGELACLC